MLKTVTTNKFEKDVKRALKRGYDLNKLYGIMNKLVNEREPSKKFSDHPLKGNYHEHRECHIEPNWLLIYRIEATTIKFVRTGSHSDLF